MRELLRDSAFGRILNLVSGGKLFPWEEFSQSDPLKQHLANGDAEKPATVPIPAPGESLLGEESPTDNSNGNKESDGTLKNFEEGQLPYTLVNWKENDPANPRNWSTAKKFFVTFQICLLTASVYIGAAIYTAGILSVMEDFHVGEVAAVLGLTLFVIGYALGPMIFASMSEMPFIGRMPVYIGTLVVFVFLQFAVIYAKNYGMLMAFRFLTGFFGSPVLATGGATIADMYKPSKQVYGLAIYGTACVLGPVFGPLVGGFAAENKGWQWTIWELVWLSGACLIFLFFFLPETSSSNILFRRTCRLRKVTGIDKDKLKCEPEVEAEGLSGHEIVMMVLVRPFTLNLEPICFLLNMYIALIYGVLYIWFESFPIVFIGIYGFSLGTLGLAFLGLLVGSLIVLPPFFWWVDKYLEPRFNENGELHPELRMIPAMVGAFFIPVCLFWFGWSARPSVHWIMPIIGSAFFSIGTFLLFMAVLSYLGDAYPRYIASVYAGNDLMRSAFGAAFPLFATAMYRNLGVGWASSVLGFLSIVFIPIPFLLYKFGERIRKRSKMARHDL